MDGWIKIHRCIDNNDLWHCEPFSRGQAWIDLIILANHKESFFYKRGNKVIVKRGEVGRSEVELADRWQWSRTKVRSFLEFLEKEQQITIVKSPITQVLTIINYDVYQEKEQQKDSTNTTEVQQKNTYKNDKKEKNDKNFKQKKESEEKEAALSLKVSELEKNILELQAELKKEKEKSCGKKEKEPHKFPKSKGKPKAKLTPRGTPPHKTDLDQQSQSLKPYEMALQDYQFPNDWDEDFKEALNLFFDVRHEKAKGNFGLTQVKSVLGIIKKDVFQHGMKRVENCLILCAQNGWNYDIKYQINKESRDKEDETKRNKQLADDPTISTAELAVMQRLGKNIADFDGQGGYNSTGLKWYEKPEQEF